MSRHGPPSGPFSGEPDPRYEPPSDPWGEVSPPSPGQWGEAGQWGDATPPYAGYDGVSAGSDRTAWSERTAAPPARRNGPLLVLVIILSLVVAGGTAAVLYLASGDRQPVVGSVAISDPPGGGGETDPTPARALESTKDNLGLAAGYADVGDCLVNDGSEEALQMRITLCEADEGSETYQVVARFDEPVADDEGARDACLGVEGYTHHYYFISETPRQSFVLCMSVT